MKKNVLIFLLTILMTGCATRNNLDSFYAHRPKSIVVVPVLNESLEVTASSVFITTITKPLAEKGYYVFPVHLTDMVLKDFGLAEAGHIHQLPANRFYDLFGADAALFITIKDWSTKYLVLVSTVTVEMEYILKDTRTGEILWKHTQPYVHSSGAGGEPISMMISAALTALLVDYLPLAKTANYQALQQPYGIPVGQYHPDYEHDRDQY